ncbi:MocR-like pyridoxine biosynthesis transcription factor PdxR [Chengkuizengella axinellae]|uniref:PLP-dependent aminotransferase family protein n=1 Tax=Chengkuizengella axinellae TaxID=3064388 RepID=A0ABT9IZU8_9BACL|nr:PLP-dependent aminotransferase family protein [Chengkuizengella sp. 2205SS18-9]MDP5274898.1 PLP-dependent aminotransferase family protein [Chengkuizengella sp. 2205SS18-9]
MMWIPIDRTLNKPLIRQIYEQIRMQILQGRLKGGDRLPSTRVLSSNLNVSRNVVLEAYEQLYAEGFIESKQGTGTYVAEGTYLEQEAKSISKNTNRRKPNMEVLEDDVIDFKSGIPALDLFPRKKWGQISREVYLEAPDSIFGYGKPEGRSEIRDVLCDYLLKTRGVRCTPEQLVITTGATQSFSLVTQLLLSHGDDVCIEDPITHELHTIFAATGAKLCPIPVDQHGMQTELIPTNINPGFIYVTPSHQFPLGGILPIDRRIQLIQYARKHNCFIVEDDYDSEYRFEGSPISSIQGLDPDRVIYIGTFSKILSPALRIGYIILPNSLIERCKNIKWLTDLHTPTLEQLTIARFIDEGYLERHIRKMKKTYKKRRDYLKKCLDRHFGTKVNVLGDFTGLHLIAEFDKISFSNEIVKTILKEHKVKIYPVEQHAIEKGKHCNKIILGYGNLDERTLEKGVKRLRDGLILSIN